MKATRNYTMTVAATPTPGPHVYTVGPGQGVQTLAGVPWDSLTPGGEVRIFWRPEPYREKFRLSPSGTQAAPIRLRGMAGPGGQRPIIDGTDATTALAPFSAGHGDRSTFLIAPGPQHAEYYKPKWLSIEGLSFQGAYIGPGGAASPLGYTDANGLRRNYTGNAAPVFVERGDHISFVDCEVTNGGNGFFVGSGNTESTVSRDIKCIRCHIHGNGTIGEKSDRRHNSYTEAIGMLFDGCTLGPMRPGAMGQNLFDRSAGTVVRNCTVTGGVLLLMLGEPDGGYPLINADPSYKTTIVEDCTFANGPFPGGAAIVHYGGTEGVYSQYRNGTLHFRRNKVTITGDRGSAADWYRTALFRVETNESTVEFSDTEVVRSPRTPGKDPLDFHVWPRWGTLNVGNGVKITKGWTLYSISGPEPGTVVNGAEKIVST